MVFSQRPALLAAVSVALLLVSACSFNRAPNRAPVEDRTGSSVRPMPGAENAGKPGYYTVRPGDTLNRIALDQGQSWRDIARWNSLANPNVLEVGQVLRIQPPPNEPPVAVTRPIAPPTVLTPTTPPQATPPAASSAGAEPAATAPVAAAPATAASAGGGSHATNTNDDDVNWLWPTNGTVIAGYDEVKNKGLDFAGAAGDPVLAAADGRVVYAGAGLRGYGNLVILKHNNTYLTAYAHNQVLLVKEDQTVRRGQKIAEMGNSDADRVKLHFEVRRQGKPVDPARYLPGR